VILLKTINRAIARFCNNHRRFGLPGLMRYLVIISAAAFLINMMDTTGSFTGLIAFNQSLILRGQLWRLVTWVFIPIDSNLIYLALSLYFYYWIGNTLEQSWGFQKFTLFYIVGVVLNIVAGFVLWAIFGYAVLDPSYLNLSMFFAFAALYPEQVVRLFFFIPIKIKWLALADAVFFVIRIVQYAVGGLFPLAIVPLIAIVNLFVFCGDDLLELLAPLSRRIINRANPKVINYKQAARKIKREEAHGGYRHKCDVCGRTDTDNPELEFRYCSRCEGYHCFCGDHINNHVHFQ
jgi:hypothetical protein